MIKLTDILNEIGDATSKPYDYTTSVKKSGEDTLYVFKYDTENDIPFRIEIHHSPDFEFIGVDFGVPDKTGALDYKIQFNDTKQMYRTMATVMSAIKEVMKIHPDVDGVQFMVSDKMSGLSPESSKRFKLYTTYLKKQFPNSEIETSYGTVTVYFNRKQ